MRNTRLSLILTFLVLIVASCVNKSKNQDLVNDVFEEEQEQIREAIHTIVRDAETANLEGLKDSHLASKKFTKFGPRNFERQDVERTNESELAFFGTVSNYKEEVKDLKIDVLGEVGIATYYRDVSFEQDGEKRSVDLRQTLVFLKTKEGWKIVHEHGTRPM